MDTSNNKELFDLIKTTKSFVNEELTNTEGGHDYWHAIRVFNTSVEIGTSENGNLLVIALSALLHDIADHKFHGGDEEKGAQTAQKFLIKHKVNNTDIEHIVNIINNISFSKSFEKTSFESHELDIVRDADMLDAIGAIGIARTFNYGGFKGNEIYSPDIPPRKNLNKLEYRNGKSTTINHFYEKLFLLKDRMKTKRGKELAAERHQFMEEFVNRFYREWEGEN